MAQPLTGRCPLSPYCQDSAVKIGYALDSSWDDVWRILRPIIAAGDTYCWPHGYQRGRGTDIVDGHTHGKVLGAAITAVSPKQANEKDEVLVEVRLIRRPSGGLDVHAGQPVAERQVSPSTFTDRWLLTMRSAECGSSCRIFVTTERAAPSGRA